jgi:hypothetical protein
MRTHQVSFSFHSVYFLRNLDSMKSINHLELACAKKLKQILVATKNRGRFL